MMLESLPGRLWRRGRHAAPQPDLSGPDLPLISVVIPAYNAEATIGAAISGVLTQQYPNVEIVVVDDGSSDRTAAVAASYGDRVQVIRQDNAGTAAARNAGIGAARGEFIAPCDADDVLLPGYLSTAFRTWRQAGGGRRFVSSNARLLTTTGIVHGKTLMIRPFPASSRQRNAILRENFVAGFILCPTAMLRELGGFDREATVEDWDLWLRAIMTGWEVVPQPESHALYRWTPGSKSTKMDEVYEGEKAVLRRALSRFGADLTPGQRAYLGHRVDAPPPRALVHEGDLALRSGHRRRSHQSYRRAMALLPGNRRVQAKAILSATPVTAPLLLWLLREQDRRTGRDPSLNR